MDYHRRILAWFDHYVKGEPAPDWILKGEPVLEREKELKRIKKDEASTTRTTDGEPRD
jgi:hypothetical protein